MEEFYIIWNEIEFLMERKSRILSSISVDANFNPHAIDIMLHGVFRTFT